MKSNHRYLPYVFILVIACLTYVPGLFYSGFYRDDWHMLWAANNAGPSGVFDLFKTDRPFMGLIYGIEWLMLGNSPLAWNLFALILKVAGTTVFYELMRHLLPEKKQFTIAASILFLVYPGFLQLPNGNTIQNHLMGLFLALLSLLLSVKSWQSPQTKMKVLYGLFSLLFQALYLPIYEYMIGFEVVRVMLLLWLQINAGTVKPLKALFSRNFKSLAASFAVTGAFLFWRFFIFSSSRSTVDVGGLLAQYRQAPLQSLTMLFGRMVSDLVEAIFLAWSVPLYDLVLSRDIQPLLLHLVLIAAGAGLFVLLIRRQNDNGQVGVRPGQWLKVALLGGAIALASILPVIAGNRQILFSDTFDRYTLHVIPGAVLCLIALIWGVIANERVRLYIVTGLVVSAMFVQLQNAREFGDKWEAQRQLWWQLSWRAPQLKSGTTLLPLLPEGARLAEHYEVWAPANLIYAQHEPMRVLGEIINQDTIPAILSGDNYGRTFRRLPLVIDLKNSLVLSLAGDGSCLHIPDGKSLTPSPHDAPVISLISKVSNTDLIDGSQSAPEVPTTIFGPEPHHGWCYYYQKAGLASQNEDWHEVARLAEIVGEQGLEPADSSEWMPFYRAYAALGDVPAVTVLAEKMRADDKFISLYCSDLVLEDYDEGYRQYLTNLCPELWR